MTDWDKKLQEMAIKNWEQFAALIGEPAIVRAKICLLRKQNKSYGEICNSLGVSRMQARTGSGNCCPNEPEAEKTMLSDNIV